MQPGGIRHRDEGGDDHASCLTGLVGIGVKKLLCLQSLFVQPLLADICGCIFTSVDFPLLSDQTNVAEYPAVQVLLHTGKDLGGSFVLHCLGYLYIVLGIVLKIFHGIIHFLCIKPGNQFQVPGVVVSGHPAQLKISQKDDEQTETQIYGKI